jgi:hypothetical protein
MESLNNWVHRYVFSHHSALPYKELWNRFKSSHTLATYLAQPDAHKQQAAIRDLEHYLSQHLHMDDPNAVEFKTDLLHVVTQWMNRYALSPIDAESNAFLMTLDGLIVASVSRHQKPHGWDDNWQHHLRPMCHAFVKHLLSTPDYDENAIVAQIVKIYHAVNSVWLVVQGYEAFRNAFQRALNDWFQNIIARWGHQHVGPIMHRVRREYQIPTLAQLDTDFHYLLQPHADTAYWTQWWTKKVRVLCKNFIHEKRNGNPFGAEPYRLTILDDLALQRHRREDASDALNLRFIKPFEGCVLQWINDVLDQYPSKPSDDVASWRPRTPQTRATQGALFHPPL